MYHFLIHLILILGKLLKPFLPEKIIRTLDLRLWEIFTWRHFETPKNDPILVHAASGEIEYLRPILRKLKTDHPEIPIFLTFFSPSALNWLHKIDEIDGWAPIPFDEPQKVASFISQIHPRIVILSRTDIWPNFIQELKRQNIPVALIAATFSSGSRKTSFFAQQILRKTLPLLHKIFVVSQDDQMMGKRLFPTANLQVAGDPRYDQVEYRINQHRELPFIDKTSPIVVFGSTWPEDEVAIFRTLEQIESLPTTRFIWVPHENTKKHLEQIHSFLEKQKVSFDVLSDVKDKKWESKVLIVDEFGWLLDLYKAADISFIGGSFKAQVHSVMEALGSGNQVIVGPHYLNNREAIEFSKMNLTLFPGVISVNDPDQFVSIIRKYLSLSFENRQHQKEQIRAEFVKRLGATQFITQEIYKWL